jgi:hypothetical protein
MNGQEEEDLYVIKTGIKLLDSKDVPKNIDYNTWKNLPINFEHNTNTIIGTILNAYQDYENNLLMDVKILKKYDYLYNDKK